MQLFSSSTGGKWVPLVENTPEEAKQAERNRDTLKKSLLETLRAENLVVLTGLGTSLCVMEGSTRLAPTMADLWDAARTATGTSEFDALLGTVRYTATEPDPASLGNTRVRKDIELLLSHCQLAQAFSPAANIETFIHDTEQLIVRKCAFVKDGFTLGTHETFLRRVARRSTRSPRTRLFTTNYDLCFEQAASSAGFIVLDGFSHTLPQRFNSTYFAFDFVRRDDTLSTPDFLPNVFQLYKLHGSVDWDRRGDEVFRMTQPTTPVLIYPRDSKFELSYEPPYLEMMGRFLSSLRQPKTALLVIGFGFNDKHLTQPILSAIRSNVGLRVTVVDPALATSTNDAVTRFTELVSHGDARISLVAAKFEQFVPLLPDLVAVSEEEQHEARFARRTQRADEQL
jgi:hypothetical protein